MHLARKLVLAERKSERRPSLSSRFGLATVVVASTLLWGCRATPTSTAPAATATPYPFEVLWTAQQVVDAFAAAGLPVSGARALEPGDESWDAASAIAIELPSIRTPSPDWPAPEVRVLAFDDSQAFWRCLSSAHLNRNYLPSSWEPTRTPIGFGWAWVVTRDNVIVDLTSDVPHETALRYEQALESMEEAEPAYPAPLSNTN